MKRRSTALILTMALATLIASCAEPVRRPDKVKPVAEKSPVAERPGWVDGEFEGAKMFWGTGWAAITEGEDAARAAASESANENLAAELQLLVAALSTDHEEQIAEVISQYPLEEFNVHMAGAKAATVAGTEVMDTYIDRSRKPTRLHVLVKVSPDAFFQAVEAQDGLPTEQKNRIKDYGNVFLDGVMENLGR